MNMNIIQQFDVEIVDGKLIIIDFDYYKPCNSSSKYRNSQKI